MYIKCDLQSIHSLWNETLLRIKRVIAKTLSECRRTSGRGCGPGWSWHGSGSSFQENRIRQSRKLYPTFWKIKLDPDPTLKCTLNVCLSYKCLDNYDRDPDPCSIKNGFRFHNTGYYRMSKKSYLFLFWKYTLNYIKHTLNNRYTRLQPSADFLKCLNVFTIIFPVKKILAI